MSVKVVAIVSLSVLLSGFAHGLMTDRWGVPASVSRVSRGLDQIPRTFGEWRATDIPVSSRTLIAAGAENIVDLDFQGPRNDHVRVMLVIGRPGPVCRHPPNVCFVAGGLRQTSDITASTVPLAPQSETVPFSHCLFASDESPVPISTLWSFSANGRDWQIPANPRIAFAHCGWLCKLYVIATDTQDEQLLESRRVLIQEVLSSLKVILK